MRSPLFMPGTVGGPGEAEAFTVIYDFEPTGHRRDASGRFSRPTGTVATGTWKAYRTRPDGTLEIIPGRGVLRQHIEDVIEEALAA
jgi:hypothetical protein